MHTSSNPSAPPAVANNPADDRLTSQINHYLDNADYARARPLISEVIEGGHAEPRDYLLAGIVSLQVDEPMEARRFFEKALTLMPDNADALHNLAVLSLNSGDADSAARYLSCLRRIDPTSAAVRNDLAVVELQRERPHRALVGFRRALRLDPKFSAARNSAMEICLDHGWLSTAKTLLSESAETTSTAVAQAEINRWRQIVSSIELQGASAPVAPTLKGKKIAVFAAHDAFVKSIVSDLSRDNTVRNFTGETIERIGEMLQWADLAWFEWCDNLLIAATGLPKHCPIICRLHSYEAFTEMPGQVDWTKVDHLIYVNKSVRELVGKRIPPNVRTSIIYNGVDLHRFALPPNKPITKKIGSVGYINYKKNPSLLLYAFKKIHEYDPEYTLHIAGQHQDPRIELYITNFLKRHPLPVFFDGWVGDMPGWYRDKQFVISTSLFESFHYSIAEGMASGCLPLIHDWYGADYLYPEQYLFGDPDSCLELVKTLESSDVAARREENRRFIAGRYSLEETTARLRDLCATVVGNAVVRNEEK